MKNLPVCLLIFGLTGSQAQDITISFQPEVIGTPIDSIWVTNLKTDEKVKLLGNDSLDLSTISGVFDIPHATDNGYIYPNPCYGDASLGFFTTGNQEVEIRVYNISGQLMNLKRQNLAGSYHRFQVKFPVDGIYTVYVLKNDGPLCFKSVCIGTIMQTCQIDYSGSESIGQLKSTLTLKTLGYTLGDILHYSVYSGKNNTIVMDSPTASKVCAVEFFECMDQDNQNYPIVKIGNQWWMAKNMAYLPSVSPSSAGSEILPFYYVYGYNGSVVSAAKATPNYSIYGALYNWTAAMNGIASSSADPSGVRGTCPTGWHLPSDAEWTTLETFLGNSMAGGKMKETGTTHWQSSNDGATNESGFYGLPGGYRNDFGEFSDLGLFGLWWSPAESSNTDASFWYLSNTKSALGIAYFTKKGGFSARCVKDIASLPTVTTNSIINFTSTTATGGGNVTSDGGETVTQRGVCWNTIENPTLADSKTTDGTGTGTFTSNITGLAAHTKYYLRAYAISNNGTGYGDEVIFTTANPVSEIFSIIGSASTWTSDIDFAYISTSGNISTYRINSLNFLQDEQFKIRVNHQWDKSYGYNTVLINGESANFHLGSDNNNIQVRSERTYDVTLYVNALNNTATLVMNNLTPSITTNTVTSITSTSSVSGGNILNQGNSSVTARGVCWNTTGTSTTTDSKTTDGTGIGTFTGNLTGLTNNTLYYVRAYATNSIGTAYGNEVIFTTANSASVIFSIIGSASTWTSDIDFTYISTSGNISTYRINSLNFLQDEQFKIRVNHQWDKNYGYNNVLINGESANFYLGSDNYNIQVRSERTYEVTLNVYWLSDTVTLVMNNLTPSITTNAVTSITSTSSISGGNILNQGSSSVTARGVCWNTNGTPTTTDSKTTDGTGTGTFTSSMTGLTANTPYYTRAYAVNSQGPAYGEQVMFTAGQASTTPTVTTSPIYSTLENSAHGGGNVTSDGGAAVTARGVCWSTSENPTISNSITTDGTGIGYFTSILTGLTTNSLYYVRAYAVNSQGPAYGGQVTFLAIRTPDIQTTPINNLMPTTATSGGMIRSYGISEITARGVCWSTSEIPTISNSKTTDGTGNGYFSSSLTGLTTNSLYYVRAYAVTSQGPAYGNQVTFTPRQENPPTVTLLTSIDGVSTFQYDPCTKKAYLKGKVFVDGGAAVTARGICWNTTGHPSIADNKTIDGTGTGIFSSIMTGMLETRYYFYAYATNSAGTAYGSGGMTVDFGDESFKQPPTVHTNSITNITQTTAIGGGNVTSSGAGIVTAKGVCWNTTGNPTIADSKTTDDIGFGTFTSSLTGLTANTLYYVCAYATNCMNTAYGEQVTFTTSQITTPTVITSPITAITSNTAIGGGNVTSDGGAAVTARGVCWSVNHNPTLKCEIIGFCPYTTDGPGTGKYTSNIAIAIIPNTTYYVRAYAKNAKGTAFGEEVTFTTLY